MFHQFAGQDEQGDGEQREGIDAGENALRHHQQGNLPLPQQGQDGGRPERQGDRHIGEQQDDEGEGEDQRHSAAAPCACVPLTGGAPRAATKWNATNTPPAGSAA